MGQEEHSTAVDHKHGPLVFMQGSNELWDFSDCFDTPLMSGVWFACITTNTVDRHTHVHMLKPQRLQMYQTPVATQAVFKRAESSEFLRSIVLLLPGHQERFYAASLQNPITTTLRHIRVPDQS